MFLTLAHKQMDVYIISKSFVLHCYKFTKTLPSDKKFNMIQQIRRAALSVHLNIAEGASRKSPVERRRYYEIARGSVIEIDAALDIAVELNYTNKDDIQDLGQFLIRCFQVLTKMTNGR